MTWRVLPHGPLQKLAPNLWRVQGEMKIPMKRAMDLVRRPNGEVWIHNAVALDEASMGEIEAWGRPSVLLVPSGYHRIDPAAFKTRYPSLRVFCPKGSSKRVREVVALDGTYDDLPADADFAIERIEGVGDAEAAVRVESEDGASLLSCDAVFNMKHRPGVKGFFLKAAGSTGGPRVTRIFRTFVLKDAAAFKASLLRLAALPKLVRVLPQHEDPIDGATLRAIAEGL